MHATENIIRRYCLELKLSDPVGEITERINTTIEENEPLPLGNALKQLGSFETYFPIS